MDCVAKTSLDQIDLYGFRGTRRETYTVTVQHKQRPTNALRYTYNPPPAASLAMHGRRLLEKESSARKSLPVSR